LGTLARAEAPREPIGGFARRVAGVQFASSGAGTTALGGPGPERARPEVRLVTYRRPGADLFLEEATDVVIGRLRDDANSAVNAGLRLIVWSRWRRRRWSAVATAAGPRV